MVFAFNVFGCGFCAAFFCVGLMRHDNLSVVINVALVAMNSFLAMSSYHRAIASEREKENA